MKQKGKLGKFVGGIWNFAEEHERELKLAAEITGIILLGISAAKAGYKAGLIFDEKKEEVEALKADFEEGAITEQEFIKKKSEIAVDTAKEIAPVVLPPIIIGGATVATAFSGYAGASKQIAALSAAYNISEKSLLEYKENVTALLGEKKAEEVKETIAKKTIEINPPAGKEVIITGKGNYLCYDVYSGRYFRSNIEAVNSAVNKINKRLMDEYFISLGELYYEMGLPDIKLGSELGFCIDDGLIEVDYTYKGEPETGEPVCYVDYDISPKYHARMYE